MPRFSSRESFDRASREYVQRWNATCDGAREHGPVSCAGVPHPIISYRFDFLGFEESGCDWDCCRCGRCSRVVSGKIADWPLGAPWHGPAANLREHYTPEQLRDFGDRYRTDWGADGPPDPESADRATVDLEITRSLKDKWTPVVLPELPPEPHSQIRRWLDECRWKAGPSNVTAWRARRNCEVTGEIRVASPTFIPLCVRDNLRTSIYGSKDNPHHVDDGGALVHHVALEMSKGDVLFLGSLRENPNITQVGGNIRLSVGHPQDRAQRTRRRPFVWIAHADLIISAEEQYETPDGNVMAADKRYPEVDHGLGGQPVPGWARKAMSNNWGTAWWVDTKALQSRVPFVPPDQALADRIESQGRWMSRQEVAEAWERSPGKDLDLMFSQLPESLLDVLNARGEGRETARAFGGSLRFLALPRALWDEILEVDKTDETPYHQNYYMCGNYSADFKAGVLRRFGVNGVAVVCDASAGPDLSELTPEQVQRIPEDDLAGHAYVALLTKEDGQLAYFRMTEPQTDRRALKASWKYPMKRGFAII